MVAARAAASNRKPGELLDELDGHAEHEAEIERVQAEGESLRRRLEGLADERREMLRQRSRGRMTDDELDEELARIDYHRDRLESRLQAITLPDPDTMSATDDLLDEIRVRLAEGLSDEHKQEIVRLLVAKITITTIVNDDGTKDAKATIDHRFPAAVETRTATRAGLDYRNVQRVVQFPPGGRWPRKEVAA